VKAVVKTSAERGAEYVTDYPDPKPADGQVVIEVAAASLCGTHREPDLSLTELVDAAVVRLVTDVTSARATLRLGSTT